MKKHTIYAIITFIITTWFSFLGISWSIENNDPASWQGMVALTTFSLIMIMILTRIAYIMNK